MPNDMRNMQVYLRKNLRIKDVIRKLKTHSPWLPYFLQVIRNFKIWYPDSDGLTPFTF